ncbi:MAG: hypothetical protein K2O59_12740 [Lachnospiraceae bacterium]|nr:hypothetical protein [Lachnospiraceae bacterium]
MPISTMRAQGKSKSSHEDYAPCGAGLSYEQPEASRRLNAPAEKATETTAAMRELAERRYTV